MQINILCRPCRALTISLTQFPGLHPGLNYASLAGFSSLEFEQLYDCKQYKIHECPHLRPEREA